MKGMQINCLNPRTLNANVKDFTKKTGNNHYSHQAASANASRLIPCASRVPVPREHSPRRRQVPGGAGRIRYRGRHSWSENNRCRHDPDGKLCAE